MLTDYLDDVDHFGEHILLFFIVVVVVEVEEDGALVKEEM